MTGHQGHKDVSRWVTDAFREVAKPGARLFYATQTPEFVAEVVPALEQFNIFLPGTPPVTGPRELGIAFSCDDDTLDLKIDLARGAREPDRGAPRGVRRAGPAPVPA